MASTYSSAKFVQPLSLNSTINGRSRDNSLFGPLKTGASFLGSTRKLRVNSVQGNQAIVHRPLSVVAVSEVVREKKVKSGSSLVTHSIFFHITSPVFFCKFTTILILFPFLGETFLFFSFFQVNFKPDAA